MKCDSGRCYLRPNIRRLQSEQPDSTLARLSGTLPGDSVGLNTTRAIGLVETADPGVGKPVLVMREKTERPEGVEAGAARLVGTDSERIFSEAAAVLAASPAGPGRPRPINPYGDGRAADPVGSRGPRPDARRRPRRSGQPLDPAVP